MKEIDQYSYQCGVMDTFNEMVKAGLKPIALAHPFPTKEERDFYLPFVKQITEKYHTKYYLDDDPLITDLFPSSLNRNTYNIIFYKNDKDIQEYASLKQKKHNTDYDGEIRKEIAYAFGHLLGYPDNMIQTYIEINDEKE